MAYSVCAILLMTSAVCESVFRSPPAKQQKVRGDYVWLRKVDPGYLAQFPQFPD
jgi:hypothetical protein